jgi:hypothetical protein
VHVSRIKPYKDRDLNITQELKDHAGHVEGTLEVDKFDGVRKADNHEGWEIRTLWRGFEEADATWEPLEEMIKDVPVLVEEYLASPENKNLPAELTGSRQINKAAAKGVLGKKGKGKKNASPRSKSRKLSVKKVATATKAKGKKGSRRQ